MFLLLYLFIFLLLLYFIITIFWLCNSFRSYYTTFLFPVYSSGPATCRVVIPKIFSVFCYSSRIFRLLLIFSCVKSFITFTTISVRYHFHYFFRLGIRRFCCYPHNLVRFRYLLIAPVTIPNRECFCPLGSCLIHTTTADYMVFRVPECEVLFQLFFRSVYIVAAITLIICHRHGLLCNPRWLACICARLGAALISRIFR